MKPIDIPVVGIGPGSQPLEEDGSALSYPQMPRSMATYEPPVLPEADEVANLDGGLALLRRLNRVLAAYRVDDPPEVLDLSGLDAENRDMIDQTLGEGEVSVRFEGSDGLRVQETRLAGVWRVRSIGPHGMAERDQIEVASIPGVVRLLAFQKAASQAEIRGPVPEGVLNAPPVLVELNDRSAHWRRGSEPHVVNLTLLPQSEEDLAYLDAALGQGPVTILSRGYGNCRITASGLRNVWWVQYFNTREHLILNTLEVVDVPTAALAAKEDIEDSAGRLTEILVALQ